MADEEGGLRLSELKQEVKALFGESYSVLGCSVWEVSGTSLTVKVPNSIDLVAHSLPRGFEETVREMARRRGFSLPGFTRVNYFDLKTPDPVFYVEVEQQKPKVITADERRDLRLAELETRLWGIRETIKAVHPSDKPPYYVLPPNNEKTWNVLNAAMEEGSQASKRYGGIFLLRGAPSSGKSSMLKSAVHKKTKELETIVSEAIRTGEQLKEAVQKSRETVNYVTLPEFVSRCRDPFRAMDRQSDGKTPVQGEALKAHAKVISYLTELYDSRVLVIDGNIEDLVGKRSQAKYTIKMLTGLMDHILSNGGCVVYSCRSLPERFFDGGGDEARDIEVLRAKNDLIDRLKAADYYATVNPYHGLAPDQRRGVFLQMLSQRTEVPYKELERTINQRKNVGVVDELVAYLGGNRNYPDLVELVSQVSTHLKARSSLEESLQAGLDSVFGEFNDRYIPEVREIADICEAKYAACKGEKTVNRLEFLSDQNTLATLLRCCGVVAAYHKKEKWELMIRGLSLFLGRIILRPMVF